MTIISLLLLLTSCNNNVEDDIKGTWIFLNTGYDYVPQPFRSICPDQDPLRDPCVEKLYISDEIFEYPFGFGKRGPDIERNFITYTINNDEIQLIHDSIEFKFDFTLSKNMLCLDNGKFCFQKEENESPEIKSTIFSFKVDGDLMDSPYSFWMNYKYRQDTIQSELYYTTSGQESEAIHLNLSDFESRYLIQLLERIPPHNLNRIYNNGLSHCNEISIDFYDHNEMWMGIETCSWNYENPFEIRVLILNLKKILYKNGLKF